MKKTIRYQRNVVVADSKAMFQEEEMFPLKEATYQKGEALLKEANKLGQKFNSGFFDAREAQGVLQHEVAVTDSSNAFPILGSIGAGPCIIMALYNPQNKQAALCHIDSLTTLGSLDKWISRIKDRQNIIEVHLAGGSRSSQMLVYELLIKIASDPNLVVKTSDLIDRSEWGKSLAIDTRTGEVFTNFAFAQLSWGENAGARIFRLVKEKQPSNLRIALKPPQP